VPPSRRSASTGPIISISSSSPPMAKVAPTVKSKAIWVTQPAMAIAMVVT
jgi:hypothetical protein